MTDATVTDINEYRASKLFNGETYFRDWDDEDIESRIRVLNNVENGSYTEVLDPTNPFAMLFFPKGRDPLAHPEDNLEVMRTEAQRRGL